MAIRINGVTYRSGCDIQILMASVNNMPELSQDERERRIALYTQRAEAGLDLFSGEVCEKDGTMDVCDICGNECVQNDNGLVSICEDCANDE
jgi:hypothetical protein